MSNLIRKQDAIDEWKNDFKEYINALDMPKDDYKGIMEYIDELPSAQPEQQWILCSERLPDNGDIVIVSIRDEIGDTKFNYSSYGWITTNKEYWIVDNEINNYVVAWMPLPEPYQERKDG